MRKPPAAAFALQQEVLFYPMPGKRLIGPERMFEGKL